MRAYSFQKGLTWSVTMLSWLMCESTIHMNGRFPSRILTPSLSAHIPMADTSGGRQLGSFRRLLIVILFKEVATVKLSQGE